MQLSSEMFPTILTYVGVPARKLESPINKESFEAYGISKGKIDDPNKKSILALFKELHLLNEKISLIESKISKISSKNDNYNLKLKKIRTPKKKERF